MVVAVEASISSLALAFVAVSDVTGVAVDGRLPEDMAFRNFNWLKLEHVC